MNINKALQKISQEDKINFLLKSGLYQEDTLKEMSQEELNELTEAGLQATGFKK